jgi:thioredoxin reductase
MTLRGYYLTFLDWFEERGIDLYDNSECIEILPEGVKIKNVLTGNESIVKADTIVIAAGMRAKREEALEFNETSAGYFAMVGDCITPAKIRDAVSTGYHAAYQV